MSTSPPLSPARILQHDEARVRALSKRLRRAATAGSDTYSFGSNSIPLKPGQYVGIANYVTTIDLGTPKKSYIVVVDTGSSFNWLQCQPCTVYCHDQTGPIFDPSTSATYKKLSCTTPECDALTVATLNPAACTSSGTCLYQASYGDGSFSVGVLSQDSLSLAGGSGPSASLKNFVFGCGLDNEGLFGRSAGLIGLARNKLSLLGQLSPSLGYAFSYCLPTSSSLSGSLSIGKGSYNPSKFFYTPMLSDPSDHTLYFLRLTGVTVSGKAVHVSPSSGSSTSPMIIDSGTVITRLDPSAYAALRDAFKASMSKYPTAPAYSILDTCYKGSPRSLSVPEVALVFQGGATLKLGLDNLLYQVKAGISCLAFAPGSGTFSIIGNHQQLTYTVAYDVTNSRIGFAAGGCA
ncbi:hypothetical protein ACLOJK_041558 [Asimina triloba]